MADTAEPQTLQLVVSKHDPGMDTLQFISSLAWPVAAIVIAVMFRAQISGLVKRIEEIGFGDAKVKFNKEVKEAEKQADAVEATTQRIITAVGKAEGKSTAAAHGMAFDQTPEGLSPTKRLATAQEALKTIDLVTVAPKAAVIESYVMIEKAIEDLAIKHGLGRSNGTPNTFDTAKKLKGRDVLNAQMMGLLAHLRKLRNDVAHGGDADTEGALRYVRLVSRFLNMIADL